MITIGTGGVEYFSQTKGQWVAVTDGRQIPEADYDAMPPWERYCVLAHFADQGSEPERTVFDD